MPRPSTAPSIPASGPAVAMLQITDVPLGLRALDAIVKEAPVEVFATGTVQPGHYLIAFGGTLEAVQRSYARATAIAGGVLFDGALLPDAEGRIVPAFRDGLVRAPAPDAGDALGIVQSPASPVLLSAVDAALKGAYVDLVELRVAEGLGGKSLATLWGELPDVEAAIELACAVITRRVDQGAALLGGATTSIIPNADVELHRAVASGTRFFREWRG